MKNFKKTGLKIKFKYKGVNTNMNRFIYEFDIAVGDIWIDDEGYFAKITKLEKDATFPWVTYDTFEDEQCSIPVESNKEIGAFHIFSGMWDYVKSPDWIDK